MSFLKEHKIKVLIISIEIAVVFWALWNSAESIVLELAILFSTTPEVINNFLILQGVLVLIALGAVWKLIQR